MVLAPVSAQEESGGSSVPSSPASLDFGSVARLPYQQLIKIARSDSGNKPDDAEYKLRIKSRIPTVKPGDIELFLDVEDKPLILVVDKDGFVEVPNTEELYEANPDLVSNQPKGSMNIFVDLAVPKVTPPKIGEDGKVEYRELFKPLVEIQNEMKKVDPTFGLTGRDQFILEIETGEEAIKITRAFGTRTYRPNSRGKVYMVMESYLYEENPEVEVPESIKMNVLPASPEEIQEIRSR